MANLIIMITLINALWSPAFVAIGAGVGPIFADNQLLQLGSVPLLYRRVILLRSSIGRLIRPTFKHFMPLKDESDYPRLGLLNNAVTGLVQATGVICPGFPLSETPRMNPAFRHQRNVLPCRNGP